MFSSNKKKDPWRKYSCDDKNEEEKLLDLYKATRDAKPDVINILVNKGKINVNQVHPDEAKGQGLTALHLAARYNQVECTKTLIKHGANVNTKDNFGFRPIHDAAMNGCSQCIMELLKHGATTTGVELAGLEFITPMYYAVKYNSLSCLEVLESGETSSTFDPNECDRLIWGLGASNASFSLLQHAQKYKFPEEVFEDCLRNSATVGNIKYFQALQEMKKNMDKEAFARKYGFLVIISTQHNHHQYLEHLLSEKFDPNEKNESDAATALHYAARYGHCESIRLLVKQGAVIEARNVDNWTPLHIALKQSNGEAVTELIAQGCDVNATGGTINDTPLHVALSTPVSIDTLKALLAGQPKIVVKNDKDRLPADVIVDKNGENAELYETLMEYVRN